MLHIFFEVTVVPSTSVNKKAHFFQLWRCCVVCTWDGVAGGEVAAQTGSSPPNCRWYLGSGSEIEKIKKKKLAYDQDKRYTITIKNILAGCGFENFHRGLIGIGIFTKKCNRLDGPERRSSRPRTGSIKNKRWAPALATLKSLGLDGL